MMAEWHVTPDFIVNNWTDELLDLMTEKLAERRGRENKPPPPESYAQQGAVSADVLAARSRGMIKVVKES